MSRLLEEQTETMSRLREEQTADDEPLARRADGNDEPLARCDGGAVDSTMQDFPLTITAILRHGTGWHADRKVITATADGYREASYETIGERVAQLAHGLTSLGITGDERVATFMWNNQEHLEAYLAIPCMGAVLHTLNIRLPAEQLVYIAEQADDRVVLVDLSLAPLLAAGAAPDAHRAHRRRGRAGRCWARSPHPGRPSFDMTTCSPTGLRVYDWPELDEKSAAAMCYTSGTTGNPKGVVYSHRSTYLHIDGRSVAGGRDSLRHGDRIAADRSDVPCECVGSTVRGLMAGRRPADAGPVPAGRPAGRHDRTARAERRRRGTRRSGTTCCTTSTPIPAATSRRCEWCPAGVPRSRER